MLISTAPNGTPSTQPSPAREFICVPIDDKWEPRVGDELRHRDGGMTRTISGLHPNSGFTYEVHGAKFNIYSASNYVRALSAFECFRPVERVPPTITMPFDESTIDEIRTWPTTTPATPAVPPAVPSTGDMHRAIEAECGAIAVMLQAKNRAYGNSIADPIKVFSKADADERINVRADDKLSRIAHGQPDDNEDAELDLIGYLIFRRAKRRAQGKV